MIARERQSLKKKISRRDVWFYWYSVWLYFSLKIKPLAAFSCFPLMTLMSSSDHYSTWASRSYCCCRSSSRVLILYCDLKDLRRGKQLSWGIFYNIYAYTNTLEDEEAQEFYKNVIVWMCFLKNLHKNVNLKKQKWFC